MHAVASLGRLIWRHAPWFSRAAQRYQFAETISEGVRILVQTVQQLPKMLLAGAIAPSGSAGSDGAASACPAAAF